MWGATKSSESNYSLERISIHAPRVGRDITPLVRNGGCRNFNPRAPCGARPVWAAMPRGILRDFNPRAPCGARRRSSRREWQHRTTFQSTRPVWGATRSPTWRSCSSRYFNPRAPCGARLPDLVVDYSAYIFQSTRPVWGATRLRRSCWRHSGNFNPRAPCGARHGRRADHQLYRHFNPRAPCGARPRMHRQLSLPSIFQSTRPVWGATDRAQNPRSLAMTFQSTRPVWGATSANPSAENPSTDFNPRAPCGARLATYTSGAWGKVFQSTRPVWGATLLHLHLTAKPKRISIHAPRVGRDGIDTGGHFPRKPISIHAPRVGRDHCSVTTIS